MLCVLQTLFKQHEHMLVVQRVVCRLALFPELDQSHRLHNSKLMGDSGVLHIQRTGNITDAHLSPGKCIDNTQPGRIAHDLKDAR